MERFERIKKECFWDYNISACDIKNIFSHGSKEEKKKLFAKIIYNSSDKLADLKLFSIDELEEFFEDFKPSYNSKYISKHIKVLKYLLLNKKEEIKGLEWKK